MSTQNLRQRSQSKLQTAQGERTYYRLAQLEEEGLLDIARMPFSIRVLVENALRNLDGYLVTDEDVKAVAGWDPKSPPTREFPFMPARVLMQDLTGVPAVVDLAAMRSAIARRGGNYKKVNPLVPVDLVIDHSVQVDNFGASDAFRLNVQREFERNQERYTFLRWAQNAFDNFTLVPPGTGIVHQVNLEYLATVVAVRETQAGLVAFPDTVVGTDSHTTMINGLGVLGWGVGGIEAEAVVLGQPYYMQLPEVIGVKLTGALKEGVTATDLVLTIVEMLRKRGVVEKFVEFYGNGLSSLPLPDRATVANMAPEYGATCGFFPLDSVAIDFLRGTGRDEANVALVEQYAKAQSLFRTDDTPDPVYTDTLELDMGDVIPSLAGPSRPQDRVDLAGVKESFNAAFGNAQATAELEIGGQKSSIQDGAVVITAITSCTNTSNPSVMIGAGLLAKKAVEKGLRSKPWVKTSLAPGSQVVTDYLDASGLTPYLDQLGFQTVGYGCTTCIGNSGPLPEPVSKAIGDHNLSVAAVVSSNRNFEGRVHAEVKANYLASPVLVVAYALAGTVGIDMTKEPLGQDPQGNPVFLADIWPSQAEIRDTITASLNPEMYRARYKNVSTGPDEWVGLAAPEGDLYEWDPDSTYIQEVPFFDTLTNVLDELQDIKSARVLVMLGDSVTTDHISPAGAIPPNRPSSDFLVSKGITRSEFNTFGARRGNHEVLMRGTFANIRLRNALAPGKEGDWTTYLPEEELTSIFEAGQKYQANNIPTLVIAGKEYGSGSSRDWAAKGPLLLGVKAVLVQSFERIHRTNLIGMGVLPLQFKAGESAATLGLTGRETFDVTGIAQDFKPGQDVQVHVVREDGTAFDFTVLSRIDTQVELDYYRNGGVLHTVLRRMLAEG